MLKRILFSEYLVLLLCLAYWLIMIPLAPNWLSHACLANIVSGMLPLLVVAIGETFVLITGEIDLSVTSVMAVAAVVGASIMTGDDGYLAHSAFAAPVAIGVMLLLGTSVGALNGACVALLGMPSFMVTLASMMFLSGGAIWYTAHHTTTSSIGSLPPGFLAISNSSIGFLAYYELVIVVVVAAIASHVLRRTVFGRSLYATGINRRTAHVSGIRVRRTVVGAFAVCGLSAAITAILLTSRLATGIPVLGRGMLLDIVGAVVIGGTSLFGGKGKINWTIFGVLFLVLIDNSLRMRGESDTVVLITKGSVILIAAIIDAARNRWMSQS